MSKHNQLIVTLFDGAERADEAREALQALDERSHVLHLSNIAVVRRDDDGAIAFSETAEARTTDDVSGLAMVVGWIIGAAGAVLGAPLGPAQGVGIGAATGLDAAVQRDVGFPDEALRHLGERLQSGHSALVTLVAPASREAVLAELARFDGTPIESTLPPETLAELER